LKNKFVGSLVVLTLLILAGCSKDLVPGTIVGNPDPVYYGDCSSATIQFIYQWPAAGGTVPIYDAKKNNIQAEYRLIGPGGVDVKTGLLGMKPLSTSGEVLFAGELDLTPMLPLLKGGEGSLVYFAQEYTEQSVLGFKISVNGFHSDSKVVEVIPCSRKPTATIPPSPTNLPTPLGASIDLTVTANCRMGPGVLYPLSKVMDAGQNLPVLGRNELGDWVFVHSPENSDCWLSTANGKLNVSLDQITVHAYPPLPPTPTSTNPVQGCYVYDQQQSPVCTAPCPPNAQPGGACTP
jgi:hypothetical protein